MNFEYFEVYSEKNFVNSLITLVSFHRKAIFVE